MRTIAVINLKGGVAKTITSNSFAHRMEKVLTGL